MRSGLTAVLQAMLGVNLSKLKYIEWSWGFLREFRTDDVEEMVLINTVRNAMGDNQIQCSLNNNQNSITKQKNSMNAKNNWTSCNEDEDGE